MFLRFKGLGFRATFVIPHEWTCHLFERTGIATNPTLSTNRNKPYLEGLGLKVTGGSGNTCPWLL